MQQSKTQQLSHATAQVDRILKVNEVVALTGLSRSSLYRLASAGILPAPVKTGIRASGWRSSSIASYLDSLKTSIRLAA